MSELQQTFGRDTIQSILWSGESFDETRLPLSVLEALDGIAFEEARQAAKLMLLRLSDAELAALEGAGFTCRPGSMQELFWQGSEEVAILGFAAVLPATLVYDHARAKVEHPIAIVHEGVIAAALKSLVAAAA